ncbi:MAG: L,D-transpeptidase family protein [Bacillota bacterium]
MKTVRTAVWRVPRLFVWLIAIVVGVTLAVQVASSVAYPPEPREAAEETLAPTGAVSILINVPSRTLTVLSDGEIHKQYPIAVGMSRYPTPIGEWKIIAKDRNWGDGFGTRWLGLNVPWGIYGIHGTNKPWSIGNAMSHGCIRMNNHNVEELYSWVTIDTPVTIVGTEASPGIVKRDLHKGTIGQDVVYLQRRLKELGYLTAAERADGIFGPMTEEAVKKMQEINQLEPTGKADKATRAMLGI